MARLAARTADAIGAETPAVSVLVPMRDAARYLPRTLPALLASLPASAELIVADDGSADGSAELAIALGCRVLRGTRSEGAAAARNRAAAVARGRLLVFLDADVRVHPETLGRLLDAFADPTIAAAFGSYDDDPPRASAVSVYKNLAHHFVHQRSSAEASTFWSGCGAVRAAVFADAGGFDPRIFGIEDVELGYRLRERGHRVRLVHDAQVTHLKDWTLAGWLASDLRDRALPWARLVRAGRSLPRDLNFRGTDRAASGLAALAAGAALIAPWRPAAVGVALAASASAIVMDRALLSFLAHRQSPAFAFQAAVFQLLHRLAGVAGFAAGWLTPTDSAPVVPAAVSSNRGRAEAGPVIPAPLGTPKADRGGPSPS